ncbi:segregation and condensation protein A [Planctomicrobium piriforme]|uniref:Segregation and condensation protein A n=1 Tax=Planctomicrobium piriforme TaxID=1576369 RepID=A0A1I3B775_9PLAN|nr:segregation/condensation protein A [Planctomicrobium piriforme]SFH58060.1 condensin subunit ScpA [Planctomicrobium piriforme]
MPADGSFFARIPEGTRRPMSSPWYRVELELFTGPLDLLLYLVRRDEVDIVDLPIAKITRQFQEFLEVLQVLDLDLIGDFVVMASTLVEIKSRSVLPSENEEEEQPLAETANGDPRSDLIRQLLEYKQFKDAATALDERAQQWQERYPRLTDERPSAGKDHSADRIKEVELWDLVSALGRILKRKEVEENATIRYDETPIQTYVEQIGARIRAAGTVPFSTLFDTETIRSKIVGMFLAVLELIRHHGYRCEQPADFGEIMLLPPVAPPEELPASIEAVSE